VGGSEGEEAEGDADAESDVPRTVQMRNHWITTAAAIVIWGIIVVMNVALLVLVGRGAD